MADRQQKGKRRRDKARARKQAAAAAYPSPHSYPHRDGTVRGVIVGPTMYLDKNTSKEAYSLDIVDLDGGGPVARIRLGFFAHGFTFDPRAPERAALFEKRGPGGGVVDLLSRKLTQVVAPMPDHHFYGHGSYASDGSVVFAVESHRTRGDGAISVRDSDSFAVLETFPTYGAQPHDCVLIEGGRTLAITNGGGVLASDQTPCVTFVDVATRALLDKHDISNPRINTGHIALGDKRDFAVVSAPRDGLPEETSLGGISFRTNHKPMHHASEPRELVARLFGETLSVALHAKSGTVAATTPRAGLLTFWNLYAKALNKTLELPHVRGVTLTLDGRHFVVSYGTDATYAMFDAQSLERESHDAGVACFSGSHLYTWAYPASATVTSSS